MEFSTGLVVVKMEFSTGLVGVKMEFSRGVSRGKDGV